ncbi:uncharacterized protein LOC111029568 [Myzus persicae]|uniref:uncharacterized protein LOC111029568 n=1 Tax=Myzus persicae TaxID=13164 RepID=UPI000B93981F|nr:uncharacterized protein LOC111029568 [Myzus persicae]
MGPKTTWLLLAVTMTLLPGTLSGTISAGPRRRNADGGGGDQSDGDNDDDNSYGEFEEKILRTFIGKLIEKYGTNIQSPTKSTNIQRIAKKIRTSSSKIPILDDEHIATLSIYPFLVNPFYQPSFYSSYIPLPYDATTNLIPVGQILHQEDEYHHRFLGPLHTRYPIGYTNVPGVMSSTLLNNGPEIKKTTNVQNSIPPDNQEVIQKHDKELHSSDQILNQNQDDFDHTLPIGLNLEDPIKMYQKKDEKIKQLNSKMNRKLLDHIIVDDLPNTITANQNQTTGSPEIRDLQPSTTFVEFDTSMPLDTINFPKTYLVSPLPPLTISNEPSKSEIYNNSVSQLSLNSDEFIKVKQIELHRSTTEEPSTLSNTEQLVTTVETYLSNITSDKNQENTLTSEKRSRPDEPQNSHHYSNDKYTTDILKKPIINIEEISIEIAKTTQNAEVFNALSTLPTTTMTTTFSTPLYENNDSKISKSSIVDRAETNINGKLYQTSVKKVTNTPDDKLTKVSNEQDNIMDLINSSRPPSIISITTSETFTLPYTKTSSIISQSSPAHSKYYSSTKSPALNCTTNKRNTIEPTSVSYTSLLPTILQPLNITNNTTSILVETKTEQTPLITLNSNEYINNIKHSTNISRHHDKSTRSSSTPTIRIPSYDVFNTGKPIKTVQNNLPSDVTIFSKKYQSQIPTSTEILNTYNDDATNTYFPVTTKGTKRSTLKPTATSINQYNSVQRKTPLDTVSGYSKFSKTTYNQDRYMTETSNTPQSIDDSELWYNHMNPQNALKKDVNEEQIHVLLKKMIKLLKPEIEKQTLTKESVVRLVPPRLGDPEKFVYIIYPWILDEAKNIENEERTKINANPLTTSDKLK